MNEVFLLDIAGSELNTIAGLTVGFIIFAYSGISFTKWIYSLFNRRD